MIRIVRRKELRHRVGYSPAHIDRLEKANQFPKRVELGPSAVGWIESEIQAWIEARIAERDARVKAKATERDDVDADGNDAQGEGEDDDDEAA